MRQTEIHFSMFLSKGEEALLFGGFSGAKPRHLLVDEIHGQWQKDRGPRLEFWRPSSLFKPSKYFQELFWLSFRLPYLGANAALFFPRSRIQYEGVGCAVEFEVLCGRPHDSRDMRKEHSYFGGGGKLW